MENVSSFSNVGLSYFLSGPGHSMHGKTDSDYHGDDTQQLLPVPLSLQEKMCHPT